MFYKNLPRATTCFSFFSARMGKKGRRGCHAVERNAFSPAFFGAGGRLPMGGLGVPPFAKKRETAYTVKAWAQVVQVLASADSDGDPLYTPVLHLLAEGEGYTKRGSPTREEGRFQTGAWVEVRYPPGRPSRFMQAGEVGTSAASAVLCLGAFLCFVGALVQLVQNWNLFF